MKASKKNIAITFGIAFLLSGILLFAFSLNENKGSFSGVKTTPPPENDITFQNKSITKIEYFEQKIEEKNSAYKKDRNHKPFTIVKGIVPDTISNLEKENELVVLEKKDTLRFTQKVAEPVVAEKITIPKSPSQKFLPANSNKTKTEVFQNKSIAQNNQIATEKTKLKTAKVYTSSSTLIQVSQSQKPSIQIVKARVYKDHKIKAGESVTFRLLNNLEWGELTIPANHFFTGQSSLQNGNRLQIKIEQLVLAGKVLPLSVEVMDYDQLPGIKLGKGFSANEAINESAEEGLETALNLATRGMGNFLTDPLKKMAKQQSIHLQDGYEVYLKFQP